MREAVCHHILAPAPLAAPLVFPEPTQKIQFEVQTEKATREAVCHHPVGPALLATPLEPPVSTGRIQMKVNVETATREVLFHSLIALTPIALSLLPLFLEEPLHKRTVVVSQNTATMSRPPPSPLCGPPTTMIRPTGDDLPPATTASSLSLALTSTLVIPSPTSGKSSLAEPAGIPIPSLAPFNSQQTISPVLQMKPLPVPCWQEAVIVTLWSTQT